MRIAVLGSSGTRGMGLDLPESSAWPSMLEQVLKSDGYDLEIINLAAWCLPIQAYSERIIYVEDVNPPDG